MKKIGLLYGDEVAFTQAVKERLSEIGSNLHVEDVQLDITHNNATPNYNVILDRYSYNVPFYEYAMHYFSLAGIKVINGAVSNHMLEDFSMLTLLKQHKIKVPKTAIIPSKTLPSNVHGNSMHNLQYPLDWDAMFEKIGFPANIKSNNSNDLFDCYRVYNKQDFFFIYDMSGTKTLLFQECIEVKHNIRLFVVGEEKTLLNYELHKAPKDRYSLFTEQLSNKIHNKIDKIITTINSQFNLDMYMIDIAVDDDESVYLLNINLFNCNIDSMHIPTETYNWLVDNTADILARFAGKSDADFKAEKKKNKPQKQTDSEDDTTNIIDTIIEKSTKKTPKTKGTRLSAGIKSLITNKASDKKNDNQDK